MDVEKYKGHNFCIKKLPNAMRQFKRKNNDVTGDFRDEDICLITMHHFDVDPLHLDPCLTSELRHTCPLS